MPANSLPRTPFAPMGRSYADRRSRVGVGHAREQPVTNTLLWPDNQPTLGRVGAAVGGSLLPLSRLT